MCVCVYVCMQLHNGAVYDLLFCWLLITWKDRKKHNEICRASGWGGKGRGWGKNGRGGVERGGENYVVVQ